MKYRILLNGEPDELTSAIAERVNSDKRFRLMKDSLADRRGGKVEVAPGVSLYFNSPHNHHFLFRRQVEASQNKNQKLIAIDNSANKLRRHENVKLYAIGAVPFVMLNETPHDNFINSIISDVGLPCVIDRTFDARYVVLRETLNYIANVFPGVFENVDVEIHATGPRVGNVNPVFQTLLDQIKRFYWQDHISVAKSDDLGSKTFFVSACNEKSSEEFILRREGPEEEVDGAMKALDFLIRNIEDPNSQRKIYSMRDVLKRPQQHL